ncbi:MAG: hypothetical protein JKY54_08930 [Flavobacteriales bacterium]|nr:hypothetical protein [Flavobacteriales bacterium]
MKRIILTALILVVGISLGFSQVITNRTTQQNTLFGKTRPSGAFVGLSIKPAYVNGQEAMFTGGQIAIALGKKVNFGVAGYGLLTNVRSNQLATSGSEYFIEMGYGGLLIEPILGSDQVIHLAFPILLGAGVSALSQNRPWNGFYDESEYVNSELFFIAEPGINAELNLFRFMRIAAGVGYRFIGETGVFNVTNTNLSGWTGNVTLKLGWF